MIESTQSVGRGDKMLKIITLGVVVSLMPLISAAEKPQRVNPFVPVSMIASIDPSLAPESGRVKSPLEYFPVSDLQFVGVLSGADQAWGLIQDTKGQVHRVAVGDYVGEHDGQVQQIDANEIVLEELIPKAGGYVKQRFVMEMKEEAAS